MRVAYVRSYYMLNHRMRGLLFHYKKNSYFAVGFYFFGKMLIPSVRMTLTMSKMFARIISAKKMLFWLLFSILFSCAGSFRSAIVAPFASAGIRPVVNRLNQVTTMSYFLVFWAFSWPYMVKWHNSGIINTSILDFQFFYKERFVCENFLLF